MRADDSRSLADSNTPSPFADRAYRLAFERFRRVPPDVFATYYALLKPDESAPGSLLDVGAGPGLLAELLIRALPDSWDLVALEPSTELAAAVRSRLRPFGTRVSVENCGLGDLDAPARFTAVWLSEVVHLLGEPHLWAERLATLLRPAGRVLIRTSTHEQLHARGWYRYFPAARAVDLARHPTRETLVRALTGAGFVDVAVTIVSETRDVEASLLVEMFRRRAFSTLHYVGAADLEAGLAALERDVRGRRTTTFDYDMTAYCASRRGGG